MSNRMRIMIVVTLGYGVLTMCCGQAAAVESSRPAFVEASERIQRELTAALAELDAARARIAEEKIPLSRTLNEAESQLAAVRLDYNQAIRLLDSRTLDLNNLRAEIKARQEEAAYLSNLFSEYARNFEARLHIAETQRYRQALEAARLAADNSNAQPAVVYRTQTDLIGVSLDRLRDVVGGSRFAGTAVTAGGMVKSGRFVLIGPAAVFLSDDRNDVGTVEQRLGSLEPAVAAFANSDDAVAAQTLVAEGRGVFPFDPTLGNAHRMQEIRETLWEHIRKGGPVMIPILGMALAAMLVGFYKWFTLAFIRTPGSAQLQELLRSVAVSDQTAAAQCAGTIGGPVGRMLQAGIAHIREPRELVEEIMFETVMATRLKLQTLLPFIAISASASPLLGLLGTVTGIINTFKLITVFGSGDVKTLSSGISEALITTKFGLIAAIPALLMHAFLSRRARGIVDQMEKAAVAFINQLSKTPFKVKVGPRLPAEISGGVSVTE